MNGNVRQRLYVNALNILIDLTTSTDRYFRNNQRFLKTLFLTGFCELAHELQMHQFQMISSKDHFGTLTCLKASKHWMMIRLFSKGIIPSDI
jgi:hypothetical protein